MNSAVRVRAYAKINLSLRVLGIRADGYHELRTIFQTLALYDTLTIRARRGPFVLRCDDPACPTDDTNLIWRAAAAIRAESRHRGALRDLEISLTKRIPMQAGLGGGSSDAAAALRVLAGLWQVKAPVVRRLAQSLGADVPYFLEGGTALGLDRGDVLYPLADYPPAWVTLVLPRFGVSTVEAYQWWDQAIRAVSPAAADGVNDLQAPVAAHHPEISRIVKRLQRAGAVHAAMSGSGSAVFGLFSTRAAAERAAGVLAGPARRALVTRTLNRTTYQRLAGIAAHRINLPFAPRSPGHS
jgi:4-diphosphocytidyl-2-C-methyl-D-erythritol kinase